MGCDGGTIPRRDELVRTKKKPEQKDKDAERVFRWKHCSLTQQRLQSPIVMCGLGRLYSKQNIVEALLEKEKMPESTNHIKSLKDIRDLRMTPNPAYSSGADQKDTIHDNRNAPFICALIGLEMSGKFRFVGLWTCGCVFSERALKEIKSANASCPVCQVPYNEQDVVVLNGNEEDVDGMRVKMEMRTARLLAERKAKKEVKTKSKASSTVVSNQIIDTKVETSVFKIPTIAGASDNVVEAIKPVQDTKGKNKPTLATTSKIPPSSASTSKVVTSTVNKVNKRAIICDKISDDPIFKKSKTDYSVAKDPSATEVYKSIFTSHTDEKNQDRAHWVTYNPFYN